MKTENTALNSVLVMFADSKYNYSTNVSPSATEASTRKYLIGQSFNVGSYPNENIQVCTGIEFTDNNKPAKTPVTVEFESEKYEVYFADGIFTGGIFNTVEEMQEFLNLNNFEATNLNELHNDDDEEQPELKEIPFTAGHHAHVSGKAIVFDSFTEGIIAAEGFFTVNCFDLRPIKENHIHTVLYEGKTYKIYEAYTDSGSDDYFYFAVVSNS